MRRGNNNNRFDEKKWKPIIVGIIVFVVVFVGLTLYQQASGKAQGDMIVTGDDGIASGEGVDADKGAVRPEDSGDGTEGQSGSPDHDNEGRGAEQAVIFVDVGGAVHLSGLFALPAGSRVADAIEAAGGLTENADVKYINRAFVLSDGDRLYVPTASEVRDGTAPPTAGQVTASGGAAAGSSAAAGQGQGSSGTLLININTAESEELQKLSGVGPVTAQKIIDYRTKRGGFKRIEDLMNVSGIGSKTFEKLRDYVTV